MPSSAYCLFGGFPCIDPVTAYEEYTRNGLDVSWLNRVNTYKCPLGPEPGVVYVLLQKQYIDKLDLEGSYFFELGDLDKNLTLGPFLIIKGICLTPSLINNPTSHYLIEAVDRRFLAKKRPINIRINIPAKDSKTDETDPDHYYLDSLASGVIYTWQSAVGALWEANGQLDFFPGLPANLPGFPTGYQFIGVDSYDALNTLLTKLHCTIAYDPIQNKFSIVQLGGDDPTLLQKIASNTDFLAVDRQPVESLKGKLASTVLVYFNKTHKYYGQEKTTTHDLTAWEANSFYVKSVPTGKGDRTQIFWDDLRAIVDIGGNITNEPELDARATEIAIQYLASVLAGSSRLYQTYNGIIDFIPSGQLKCVIWSVGRNGISTEIIRTVDFVEVPLDSKSTLSPYRFSAENLMPPDFSRPTYPNYFPQIQVIQVDSDKPLIQTVYDASLYLYNSETLSFVFVEKIYVTPPPDETLAKGDRFFARIVGNYKIVTDTRQLWLAFKLTPTIINQIINIINNIININDTIINIYNTIFNFFTNIIINIYNNITIIITGDGYIIFKIPLEICGYMFWCCTNYTFTSSTIISWVLPPVLSDDGTFDRGTIVYNLDAGPGDVTIVSIIPALLEGVSGPQLAVFNNVGSHDIIFIHEGGGFAPIILPPTYAGDGKVTLKTNDSITIWYDTCYSKKWRVFACTVDIDSGGGGVTSNCGTVQIPALYVPTNAFANTGLTKTFPIAGTYYISMVIAWQLKGSTIGTALQATMWNDTQSVIISPTSTNYIADISVINQTLHGTAHLSTTTVLLAGDKVTLQAQFLGAPDLAVTEIGGSTWLNYIQIA